jgi:hypothetical protein
LPVWIFAVVGNAGALMNLSGGIFIASLYTLVGGNITSVGGAMWNVFDRIVDAQSKVKNRYYYTGESLYIKKTL